MKTFYLVLSWTLLGHPIYITLGTYSWARLVKNPSSSITKASGCQDCLLCGANGLNIGSPSFYGEALLFDSLWP